MIGYKQYIARLRYAMSSDVVFASNGARVLNKHDKHPAQSMWNITKPLRTIFSGLVRGSENVTSLACCKSWVVVWPRMVPAYLFIEETHLVL